jgi:hypothetical protein
VKKIFRGIDTENETGDKGTKIKVSAVEVTL